MLTISVSSNVRLSKIVVEVVVGNHSGHVSTFQYLGKLSEIFPNTDQHI